MNRKIEMKAEKMVRSRSSWKAWQRIISGLACVTVFCTTYALILPAITAEKPAYCGLEAHTHEDSCWEEQLVCTRDTEQPHSHSEACYEQQTVKKCGQEEKEAHFHDENCYELVTEAICGMEQGEGAHLHSDDCYGDRLICAADHEHSPVGCYERNVLICGKFADPGHSHVNGCFQEKEKQTCTLEETEGHTHDETCFAVEDVLICEEDTESVHVHTEECTEKKTICGMQEHTHSLACYSDPTADTDASAWLSRVPAVLTEKWAEDLVLVAQSQLGYRESIGNYQVVEESQQVLGYTIYGAAMDAPYGEWSGAFVSWCLKQAKIPSLRTQEEPVIVPRAALAADLLAAMRLEGLTGDDQNAQVKPGDLVFYQSEGTCYAAVVLEQIFDEEELMALRVIQGNLDGEVAETGIWMDEVQFLAYGLIPTEEPVTNEDEAVPPEDDGSDDSYDYSKEPIWAIVRVAKAPAFGAALYSAPTSSYVYEENGVAPIVLNGTASGSGHTSGVTIQWRDPTSDDQEWKDLGAGGSITGNAEVRITMDFAGIDPDALADGGYKVIYYADDMLKNANASGSIRMKGEPRGTISAFSVANGDETLNIIKMDFNSSRAWVDSLKGTTSLDGTFTYQGQLNLDKILENGGDLYNLAGIEISISDKADAAAKYAKVDMDKVLADNPVVQAGNDFYLKYSVKVTAGSHGSPDVAMIDSFTETPSYILGFATTVPGLEPAETVQPGKTAGEVYLTNATEVQKNVKPAKVANGKNLAWVIGDMAPNEERTLTYYAKIDPNYVGVVNNGGIVNNAALFSSGYPRGESYVSFLSDLRADLDKNIESTHWSDDKSVYYIDYVSYVRVNEDNPFTMTDVVFQDLPNRSTGGSYRDKISLVQNEDTKITAYKVNPDGSKEELNLADYTNYTNILGGTVKHNNGNPEINNQNFKIYLGDLEPGAVREIHYTMALNVTEAMKVGNGDIGIYNEAYIYDDPDRGDYKDYLAFAAANEKVTTQTWMDKQVGAQIIDRVRVNIPAGSKVYDATSGTVTAVSNPPSYYDVNKGAFLYRIVINQKGDWDVSSSTWRDGFQQANGTTYMQYDGYVRVDAYDSVTNSGGNVVGVTDGVANRVKYSVFVKVDQLENFNFSGADIGLNDDSHKDVTIEKEDGTTVKLNTDAFVLTYYARIKPSIKGYGEAKVNNDFTFGGTVGNGNGSIILNGVTDRVTVVNREPGHKNPKKGFWYYDVQDKHFIDFHNGDSNGAFYWVIKMTGTIPENMRFQESTNFGNYNNYMRNVGSNAGFYIIRFDDKDSNGNYLTQNNGTIEEFFNRYADIKAFEADLTSGSGNIREVPRELYTEEYTTIGGRSGMYDLKITFNTSYENEENEALYWIIRTDPTQMPAKGQVSKYYNKCNFITPADPSGSWPNTQDYTYLSGPGGSVQKSPSTIRDTDSEGVSKGTGVFRVTTVNGVKKYEYLDKDEGYKDYKQTADYKAASNGSIATFLIDKHQLKVSHTAGEYPKGNDTTYPGYEYADGTYVVWTITTNAKGNLAKGKNYVIEDTLPSGLDLAYVRTSFVNSGLGYPSDAVWGYSSTNTGPQNIIANFDTVNGWTADGWQEHMVMSSLTGSQGNYNWARYGTVYYTSGNQIRMFVPQYIGENTSGNDRVEFQVVCRINAAGEADLLFGDHDFNNQVTIYAEDGRKLDSNGSVVTISGGDVDKKMLEDNIFNTSEGNTDKFATTVFPYEIVINSERKDMAPEKPVINLPLIDRMTSNMSMVPTSLLIYALPEGAEPAADKTIADEYLVYAGALYTTDAAAPAFRRVPADDPRIGKVIGYRGSDTENPIIVSTRTAEDSEGNPKNEVSFQNLPDQRKIVIRYSVSVNLAENSMLKLKNDAFWEGYENNSGGSTEEQNREYLAEATVSNTDHGAVHVVKYDKDNMSEGLKGAEFALYRAEYVTATSGMVYIGNAQESLTDAQMQQGHYLAVYQVRNGGLQEVAVRRNANGALSQVRVIKADGSFDWKNSNDLSGYQFTHQFAYENGKLQLCKFETLAWGSTDESGNLSYGFGEKDFGTRFVIDPATGTPAMNADGSYQTMPKQDVSAVDKIHFNKVYALVEEKAPDGYEIDPTPHYFVVPNSHSGYSGQGLNYFYHDVWPEGVTVINADSIENGEMTFSLGISNEKTRMTIGKAFGGSQTAFQPGDYSFGIWDEAHGANPQVGVAPEEGGMLYQATIHYDAEDFGWFTSVVHNGTPAVHVYIQRPDGKWDVYKDDDRTATIAASPVSTLPAGAAFGIIPGHEKTVDLPKELAYGTYYLYELNDGGYPIQSIAGNASGTIHEMNYSVSITGDSATNVYGKFTYTQDDNELLVRNTSYMAQVVKRFSSNMPLQGGITGTYRFGLWEGMLDNGKVVPNLNGPVIYRTLEWTQEETLTTGHKTAVFDNLRTDREYFIFEVDDDGNPVLTNDRDAFISSKQFVVHYEGASFANNSNTPTDYPTNIIRADRPTTDGKDPTVTVTNEVMYTMLPYTGGIGTGSFTALGVLLMAVSALAYGYLTIRNKKREEGR